MCTAIAHTIFCLKAEANCNFTSTHKPMNKKSLLVFDYFIYWFSSGFFTKFICIFLYFIGLLVIFSRFVSLPLLSFLNSYALFNSKRNLSAIIAINSLLVGLPFVADTVYPNIFSTSSAFPSYSMQLLLHDELLFLLYLVLYGIS